MAFKMTVVGVLDNFQQTRPEPAGPVSTTVALSKSYRKVIQDGLDLPTSDSHPYVRMTFERITREEYEAAK